MAQGPIVQEGDLSGLTAGTALTKFALVAYDTAGAVIEATAALAPIGMVDRAYAIGATDVSVLALNPNRVLHMIADAAIAVGDYVETTADGEVAPLAVSARDIANVASYLVGSARTAAAAPGDIVEIRIVK